MLAPNSRALLTEQLSPPPGFALDAAVGTSFTLELGAALIPALSFSSLRAPGEEGPLRADPVSTLEALRRVGQKLDIFCQAGEIRVPSTEGHDLYTFLEPIIHETVPRKGGLFHPKVWFIRFVDDAGEYSYRLLAQSRNLTFDNSWDAVVRLDSVKRWKRTYAANRGLSSFLKSLPKLCKHPLQSRRDARISELADEAKHIEWERPDGVDSVLFHHMQGTGRNRIDFAGRRHLIVSPFVNDRGINLIGQSRDITVLSRAEEMDKLDLAFASELTGYVVDTMSAIDNTDSERGQLNNLHAKFYVVESHGHRQRARLLLGSANATDAAFLRNIEFLVEMEGAKKFLGVDAFIDDEAPFRKLLRDYEPGSADAEELDDEEWELDRALRAIAAIPHFAEVLGTGEKVAEPHSAVRESSPASDRSYSVRVSATRRYPLPDGWHAEVGFISAPNRTQTIPDCDGSPVLTFTRMPTADITAFLIVRVTNEKGSNQSRVLRADLDNVPADRLDRILARQIDTPEKFMKLIMLMLNLGDGVSTWGLTNPRPERPNGRAASVWGSSGTLESILRLLADSPRALIDIDQLIRRQTQSGQNRSVIPEDLAEFWPQVREAARLMGIDFTAASDPWGELA